MAVILVVDDDHRLDGKPRRRSEGRTAAAKASFNENRSSEIAD